MPSPDPNPDRMAGPPGHGRRFPLSEPEPRSGAGAWRSRSSRTFFGRMGAIFRHLKSMPGSLGLLTAMLFVFGLLIILTALCPGAAFTIDDLQVSYGERWTSGAAFLAIGFGGGMLFLSIGFYRAWKWFRWAIPVFFLILTANSLWQPGVSPYDWIGVLAWALLSFWYLNRKKNVRAYYYARTSAGPVR